LFVFGRGGDTHLDLGYIACSNRQLRNNVVSSNVDIGEVEHIIGFFSPEQPSPWRFM
jgi:hypothetical protein